MKTAWLLITLILATLPLATCEVILGGTGGSVTLTNPDNTTFTFTSANQTTVTYLSNMPDGWWSFTLPIDSEEDLWVLGVLFGFIAIAIAVAFTVAKRKNET